MTDLQQPKPLRISYSSLNTFSNCPRKFEFSKLYSRRAFEGSTFAADVGTALHHGYQNYLINRDEDKALWALLKSYPHYDSWDQANDFRSLEACVETLDSMINHDPMNDWIVAEIKNSLGIIVPAIEVGFEIVLKGLVTKDGRQIILTGFIDALLRNLHTGEYRTMDIKTHRRTIRDATANYKFSAQQIPYAIVLEHIQGKPVESLEVLYLDTFVDLCEPRAEIYTFRKDSDDISEWVLSTVLECQRLIQFYDMDFFPRTAGGCMSFNKPCWYLHPCQSRNKIAIEEWLLEGQPGEILDVPVPMISCELSVFDQ